MKSIIRIPEPCTEDWAKMTTEEQGRHCNSCCKTVIDFTDWDPQEILFYLNKNAGQKVCGRFTSAQLEVAMRRGQHIVKEIASFPLSWIKKAAAIFLFAFMIGASSCNDHTQGKTEIGTLTFDSSLIKHNSTDTIYTTLGAVEPVITELTDTGKKMKACTSPVKDPCPHVLMGDVAVVPEPPLLMGEPAVVTPPKPPVPDPPVTMGIIASPKPDR